MPLDPSLTEFTTARQTIASYSYIDIANGLGIILFNAISTQDTVGTKYILSSDIFYGKPRWVDASEETSNFDFYTSTFNISRTLKGNVKIDFTIANGSSTGAEPSGYVTFTLYHYDGTNSTPLGSAITITVPSNPTPVSGAVSFDVVETIIREGDQLYLRCAVTSIGGSASNNTYLAIDPKNGDMANAGMSIEAGINHTNLNVYLPFKIDI